jgi:hypothetical protein
MLIIKNLYNMTMQEKSIEKVNCSILLIKLNYISLNISPSSNQKNLKYNSLVISA